jgi:ATP/maltotriose-dependent transcriptional regulator MalT
LSVQYLAPGEALGLPVVLNYSKLALDPPRPFLPRPRLLELLGAGPRPRVAILCAPAGSGKSTVVYQLLAGARCPTVYYRLNDADADVPQFVSYLTAGICRYEPEFGTKIKSFLGDRHAAGSLSGGSLVEIFLHEVSRLPARERWIVLDDYQQVDRSPWVPSIVASLVQTMPTGTRLAIATRSVPELPLSRWRVQGDLIELGLIELAFTWPETQQLFLEATGARMDQVPLKTVYSRTRGWAAGLALACQIAATHSPEETVRIIEGYQGKGSPIYDYLAEEVYRSQPPAMRSFLRRSSVLKYLSANACDEILGTQDSGTILEDLHRIGLFLLPVEGRGRLFKYHQLFRDFLLSKLQEEEAQETISNLRRRAATSLEAVRDWNEAVLQYAAAGDFPSAARLVMRMGEDTIESGRVQRVSRWLRELPEEIVEGEPGLLKLKGLTSMGQGDIPGALRAFDRCTALLEARPDPLLRMDVAKHAGIALHRQGRHGEAIRIVKAAIGGGGGGDPGLELELQRTLGVAYCGAGQLARAEEQATAVLEALRANPDAATRHSATEVAALRNLARVKLLQGHLSAAIDLARQAVLAVEFRKGGQYELIQAQCILGGALAASGSFQEATRAFEMARSKGGDFFARERRWIAGWFGNMCRDSGELDAAAGHYENADGRFTAERSCLLLRMGRTNDALRVAQEAVDSQISLESPPEKAHAQVAYALGMAEAGLIEPAVETIEAAIGVLHSSGFGLRYASACWRAAALCATLGDEGRSRTWLARWLGTARELGLIHFHWWDQQLFARMLAESLRLGVEVDFATCLAAQRLSAEEVAAIRGSGQVSHTGREDAAHHLGSPFLPVPIREALDDSDDTLVGCPDPQVRAAIQRELDSGRLSPRGLKTLRNDFRLTWKELLVFLSYYLQAAYEPSVSESGQRARVAEQLCLSENTLKYHVANLRRKLGIPHRLGSVAMLAWSIGQGILPDSTSTEHVRAGTFDSPGQEDAAREAAPAHRRSLRSLPKYMASVPDRRSRQGQRHSQGAILSLAVAAMLSGARSLYAVARWGRLQTPEDLRMLGFTRDRTPSVSTLHGVFKTLDVKAFEEATELWEEAEFGGRARVLAFEEKGMLGLHGEELPGVRLVAALPFPGAPTPRPDRILGENRKILASIGRAD